MTAAYKKADGLVGRQGIVWRIRLWICSICSIHVNYLGRQFIYMSLVEKKLSTISKLLNLTTGAHLYTIKQKR